MQVNVTFDEGAAGAESGGAEAASLCRWLLADSELRGRARVSTGAQRPAAGHMGDGLELVNVVLANGIALGSLITAVAAWRGSRPRPPQVRLERDGVVVTLQDNSPEQVEQILLMWNARGSSASAPPTGDDE
ncbi:hypothetical protein K7395_25905 [Streptomyces filamentosus]|uniref:Uncharacterized protein n=2 Tax=Streptomyces filamentosus TaxID=67294 RepID=A0ABY4V023_STRFL|nr:MULTISPECIES: hypothetical protein [Streptomyces]MYR78461.1 hypothetical protein [Streptomyces sp. SID5466]USC49915.1 hypothetical protein K7395_25905 [Streptomyces filamentosus]